MGLLDMFTQNKEDNVEQPSAMESGITNVLSYLRNAPSSPEMLGSIGKTAGGLGARGLEALIGAPSNIANTIMDVKDIAGSGIESLLGGVPYIGEQLKGVSEFLGKDLEATGRSKFTPEYLRENVTKKLTGESLEPTSGLEGIAQDFASDVTSFVSAGGGIKAAAKGSLFKSILQNSAKYFNLPEGVQTAVGMAGMIAGSSTGIADELKRNVKRGYNVLRGKTPEVMVNIDPVIKGSLSTISRELGSGLKKTPSKNFLKKTVNDFSKNIKGKKFAYLKDLVQAEKDIGEIGFTRELKGSKKLIRGLRGDISESINNYGKTNPDFFDAYNSAKGLFKASMAKSYIHDNIINPKIKGLIKNPVTWFLAGQGKVAAALYGAGHIEKMAKRLLADKSVFKLYGSMMKNAANESKGALIRNMKALDNKVNKVMPMFEMPKGFEDAGIENLKPTRKKSIDTGKGFSVPPGFELVN